MENIIIKKIEIKTGTNTKGDWKLSQITGADGKQFSTFDNKASELKLGDQIIAEVETKGNNINIKTWKIVKPLSQYNLPNKKYDNTASIESQTAAKIGGELLAHGIINPTDPLGIAVIEWCYARLPHK